MGLQPIQAQLVTEPTSSVPSVLAPFEPPKPSVRIRRPVLKLMFKEDPALTPVVRDRITRDLSDFANFVSGLDLDTPSATPPIGVNPGSTGGSSAFTSGSPAYYGSLVLGSKSLASNEAITAAYSGFVFNQMLMSHGDFTKNLDSKLRIGMAASIYYNWSFWNRRGDSKERWADIFWKIRERFGNTFADSLMAYTIKVTLDDQTANKLVQDGTDSIVDNYIFQKLATADFVVDNLSSKMPMIIEIVRTSPVHVDLPEKQ
jgi:hypothetical protein